jgi:1,4-dihydroxy-6-naphthoate synthase
MKKIFSIGISTCPNDTYIFGGLLTNKINSQIEFQTILDDVEVLNKMVLKNKLDIIKVSYGVVPKILKDYSILSCGGALGFGCGPIIVSKEFKNISKIRKVGIPGSNTSAFQIFKHFYGENFDFIEYRFDKIMPKILDGELDGGIIIHEGRFLYEKFNLNLIADLGELWEKKFNAPIPLGAIVIKKELADYAKKISELILNSLSFAEKNYNDLYDFINKYAQIENDNIINKHINLFVNEFTYDLTKAKHALINFLGCKKSDFI